MNRAYALGAVILTAAVLIFAMQNLQITAIEFILWEINTPASLVALVPFLGGIVIGWLSGRFRKGRKHKHVPPATPADVPALGAGTHEASPNSQSGELQSEQAPPPQHD